MGVVTDRSEALREFLAASTSWIDEAERDIALERQFSREDDSSAWDVAYTQRRKRAIGYVAETVVALESELAKLDEIESEWEKNGTPPR